MTDPKMINNETTDSNENDLPKVRRKTNFTILCLTFILVYTSYNAITNLQSSIHTDKEVGYYSLAIISGCSVLSCLFFTNPLIFLDGYTWTIVLAQFGFLLYIAVNIYPKLWLIYTGKYKINPREKKQKFRISSYFTDTQILKYNRVFGLFCQIHLCRINSN
jgi:Ion channel regulatory protein UNC-93